MQERLFRTPRSRSVELGAAEVTARTNPKTVTGVKLRNIKTRKGVALRVDGVFVAIGHEPATQLFKGQLEMKASGYLVTEPDSTRTSIPASSRGRRQGRGVPPSRDAAGMGCMAALERSAIWLS